MTKQHRNPDGTFKTGHPGSKPPLPEDERLITTSATITRAQHAWLKARGISETIRQLISKAMETES